MMLRGFFIKRCTLPALVMGSLLLIAQISQTAVASPNASQKQTPQADQASHLIQTLSPADARHLLSRTGFDATPQAQLNIAGLTRQDAIDVVIAGFSTQPERPMPAWVNDVAPLYWTRRDMSQEQQRQFDRRRDGELSQLRNWWVNEMLTTSSPQTERMVLFWHDHFATSYHGISRQSMAMARQNQTFRQLGMGNFETLLKAMIRDPALLRYLNNVSNRKASPNENLARELLELFTLGEGNYDEATVREAARALTGYGVSINNNLSARFNYWQHDFGSKSLFGKSGSFDGDDLIDLLLQQEALDHHMASRYWHWLISDSAPSYNEIMPFAKHFRASGHNLKALYRAVLESEIFWQSSTRGALIKSPATLLIGTARSLEVPKKINHQLPRLLKISGQDLFAPPNVSGWKEGAAWITPGRLLNRQTAVNELLVAARDFNAQSGAKPEMVMAASNNMGNMGSSMPSEDSMASKNVSSKSLPSKSADASMSSMSSASSMLPTPSTPSMSSMSSMTSMSDDASTMSMQPSTMVSEEPPASGLAVGGDETSGAVQSAVPLTLQLAGENYRGPVQYRVELVDSNGLVQWSSSSNKLAGGWDTEIHGSLNSRDQLPWQNIMLRMDRQTMENSDRLRVHFLNDDGGNSGDRNLFVGELRSKNFLQMPMLGSQRSDCEPPNKADSGDLYCAGFVDFSLTNLLSAPVEQSVEALNGSIARYASMHVNWATLNKNNNHTNVRIVFQDLRYKERHWPVFSAWYRVTANKEPELWLHNHECWADCVAQWPDCAWTDVRDPSSRTLRFSALGLQGDQNKLCHVSELSTEEAELIDALMLQATDILQAALEAETLRFPVKRSNVKAAILAMQDRLQQPDVAKQSEYATPTGRSVDAHVPILQHDESARRQYPEQLANQSLSVSAQNLSDRKAHIEKLGFSWSSVLAPGIALNELPGWETSTALERASSPNEIFQHVQTLLTHPAYQVH